MDVKSGEWQALSASEAAEALQADLDSGLTPEEARRRLEAFGPNRLEEEEGEPFWKAFVEELREPLILLLIFTGVFYGILGEPGDAITIFFVILTLNTIEVVNEQRARKAISALQKMAELSALVVREGRPHEILAEQVVPGDVILLQAGRRVPADARLFEGYGLAADESSLTGESVPVDKDAEAVLDASTPLAERINMAYSGTLVTRGKGKAIVTGSGMNTELGRVAALARGVREPRTPLQQAMDEVSKSLVWLALGFSVVIPVLGVLIAHQPIENMLLTGLSLAFATIPEEMPIIITMVLALGGYRLSKQNAIVKHLRAVETLGAVTVIATDKTGTLTENRMAVNQVYPEANRRRILEAGALCNDAILAEEQASGDPLEIALVRAAEKEGVDIDQLRRTFPQVSEFTFDNTRKRMSVVSKDEGGFQVWVKGTPESVLAGSRHQRSESGSQPLDDPRKQAILHTAAQMAEEGLRIVAFAEKRMPAVPANQEEAEGGLTFLGLAGLADPPRREVSAAIRTMQGAGIRSLMVTGDHPLTARAIAQQVGLDGDGCVVTGSELDDLDDEAHSHHAPTGDT
jgi:Ca2+-transporting ATPase